MENKYMNCSCYSGKKYKKCCQPFHKGKKPKNALLLMRSRYCAFALGMSEYIIKTTHKDNSDYKEDFSLWAEEIKQFSSNTNFVGLSILEHLDQGDVAFVTFQAKLISQAKDVSFVEKSKFYKVDGVWLYHSGEFL
jgi:SEC-C motif-containing protein